MQAEPDVRCGEPAPWRRSQLHSTRSSAGSILRERSAAVDVKQLLISGHGSRVGRQGARAVATTPCRALPVPYPVSSEYPYYLLALRRRGWHLVSREAGVPRCGCSLSSLARSSSSDC